MPRFFNRIRKQLAKENRFFQYSRYAIGEILLVVIGILIALQVDNWNQERREKKELFEYLISVSKNIQQDIAEVESIVQRRKETSRCVDIILKAIHADTLESIPDSIISRGFYHSFVEVYTQFNESGWESLKSSAYLGKINNTIYEEKLFDYYNLVGNIKDREASLNEFIESMEVDAAKDGITNSFVKHTYYPESIKTHELKSLLKEPSILSVFYRVVGLNQLMNTLYPAIEEKGHAFIELTAQ